MSPSTTRRDNVSPFADTDESPGDLQARVMEVLERARKREAKVPQPKSYWEEPELHGEGRQVNLRKPTGNTPPRGMKKSDSGKIALPRIKTDRHSAFSTVVVAASVVGAGVLVWLWARPERQVHKTVKMYPTGFEPLPDWAH